jgi:hypothetical protein
MEWTFYLAEVAAGDMTRLKRELKRRGYSVRTSAYLTESVPSKVEATKAEHHTTDSIAKEWDFFESLAFRYSCSFGSVSYREPNTHAI